MGLCYTKIMSPLYSDTHPEMEAMHIRLLRESPPWRKMEILAGLNASARSLALAGMRQRFPQASDDELRRRLADLLLGPDLARKVHGELENAGRTHPGYSNRQRMNPAAGQRKSRYLQATITPPRLMVRLLLLALYDQTLILWGLSDDWL
jgi:hypothetical protein